MSRVRGGLPLLLSVMLASGCSTARIKGSVAAPEAVEAEGWAPVDPKDAVGTKNRALAEAQKKAVEKASGVFVAATTKVEAAISVQQKIQTDSRGFIERYDVLSETTEDGFLKIRIRAFVARLDESRARALKAPPLGTPRLQVLIGGDDSQDPRWTESARAALRARFVEHGFSLAAVGARRSRHDSYLVVQGVVRAFRVGDARLGAFKSMRARLRLSVTDSRTGEVVLEKSGEASALNLDAGFAADQAAADAGSSVGDAAAGDLAAALWRRF